ERDVSGMEEQFKVHLERYGVYLARNYGVMSEAFRFEWGVIERVLRLDKQEFVELYESRWDREDATVRKVEWLARQLVDVVSEKVRLAQNYDRRHPLWLVVRNPYSHLP